jgi:hypothetical protein
VLDRAIKPIRSDKRAFGVLVNEAETMECSAQQGASTQRAPCLQMNLSKAAPRVANALCGFALKLRADAGTGAMAVATSFDAVHHQWRMQRRSRTFEVRVVEPHAYAPEKHGRLFLDVVNAILNPEPTRILKLGEYAPDPRPDTFDLVTFPEAFVPASTLAEVLSQLVGYAPLGCFHLGLRPSNDPTQHLFSRKELVALVDNLAAIAPSIRGDVGAFRPWLEAQSSKDLFNVGCLFGVDASGVVRVCLHPKLVASDLEISALPERTMREANLLTLVTLWPSEPQLLSVTVQPLLCSDALGLPTDRPGADPLEAVTSFAAAFGEHPPDHVDIVSVATCTPQPSTATERGTQREWHNRFRDAFRRTAEGPGCRRRVVATLRERAGQINSSRCPEDVLALLVAPAFSGELGVADALAALERIVAEAARKRPPISFAGAYRPLLYLTNTREQLANRLPGIAESLTQHLQAIFEFLLEIWRCAAVEPSLFAGFAIPRRTDADPVVVHNWTFASVDLAKSLGREEEMAAALRVAAGNGSLRTHIEVARAIRLEVDQSRSLKPHTIETESKEAFYAALGFRLAMLVALPEDERAGVIGALVRQCFVLGPSGLDAGVFVAALQLGSPVITASPEAEAYRDRLEGDPDLRFPLAPLLDNLRESEATKSS